MRTVPTAAMHVPAPKRARHASQCCTMFSKKKACRKRNEEMKKPSFTMESAKERREVP